MSNVSLERYYFVLYDGALTLKMSKMALNAFCDKTSSTALYPISLPSSLPPPPHPMTYSGIGQKKLLASQIVFPLLTHLHTQT